jgi:hypothetical protein
LFGFFQNPKNNGNRNKKNSSLHSFYLWWNEWVSEDNSEIATKRFKLFSNLQILYSKILKLFSFLSSYLTDLEKIFPFLLEATSDFFNQKRQSNGNSRNQFFETFLKRLPKSCRVFKPIDKLSCNWKTLKLMSLLRFSFFVYFLKTDYEAKPVCKKPILLKFHQQELKCNKDTFCPSKTNHLFDNELICQNYLWASSYIIIRWNRCIWLIRN